MVPEIMKNKTICLFDIDMNTLILLVLVFLVFILSFWIFMLRSELRAIRKKFPSGSYWIQYLPMGSVLLLNKLKSINAREVDNNQQLANAISLEVGIRGVSTKEFVAIEHDFIQTDLSLPEKLNKDDIHSAAVVADEYNSVMMRSICKNYGVVKA